MSTENTSTRDQILSMLKVKGSLSVSDMAVDLGITEMAVRRHLNTLERDNLIKSTLVRQAMGRPTNVYSLSQEADELFPRNYSHLTLDFLRDLQDIDGNGKVEMLFRRRENRLEEAYRNHVQGSLEERVAKLAELQNEKGYMVEWEKADEEGHYRIREFNCPISQVAREFNQACSCELSLFRRVLKADVEQTTCMAKGGEKCVFEIREANKA
ncbi:MULTISPECIES: helix-turn-helix transcriptional regulator [Brevibacillus]|jgi:predicted ArsR family transcriptional regulator|uniref:Transcriptional regulator n=1 Tax=Brevibacillus borstelensis AK1 TaxID=1300222 RepID=M8D5X5_9BACL|nr:metalloregulator ArsR/SmtB family transcription factor [Brevibacillus borstelensis]EMT51669.1 transcriptional regulator [Brevibacillus borstelensis AK1]KKX54484.1 transcriptional regulator [Brevibacillus borstelensis cifa_chp40]MBE5397421.1 transcriptional regulator [Brevibacillus borstelensis]MCC0562923.1 transcriptional regulator [Brevibacillus borstelensis]MCM3470373.1 transcriptional regulator [Brevibacillus borstelensis]